MKKSLSIGQCATLACLLEVTIPKPGNVHRGADFADVSFADFVASAVAIGPAMNAAAERRLGETVLGAVQATRRLVATNTNLGAVLLLAPLAGVPRGVSFAEGLPNVLRSLNADDARLTYQAINQAKPSGLGRVESMDVTGDPPLDLLVAMLAAADRDLVARQYTNNFHEVLDGVRPWIQQRLDSGCKLADAVIHAHVRLMSEFPDSLIARKCGPEIATESARRAGCVLDSGDPGDENYQRALGDLDFWLRSDGHRRNPGTTADLIAAGLFTLLRDKLIPTLWPPVF
jgi:triphosphoribosyl-dephospho-CoA synthase